MKIQDLKTIISSTKLKDIEFEDYNGNTVFTLSDLDLADIETNEHGLVARLQLNTKQS